MKAKDKKALSRFIDVEKNYEYSNCTPINPHLANLLLFYSDSSKEVFMVPRADIPPGVWFLLAIVALVLLPLELDKKESIGSFSPLREM